MPLVMDQKLSAANDPCPHGSTAQPSLTVWQSGWQAPHAITHTRQLQVPRPASHTIPTSSITSTLHRNTQVNFGSVSKGTVVSAVSTNQGE